MHESDTFQAILEEGEERGRDKGRLEEAKKILRLLGEFRFGAPDEAAETALTALNDLNRLESLSKRLLQVSSWQELFATPQ